MGRELHIEGNITSDTTAMVQDYLERQASEGLDARFVINSPGGSPTDGAAIAAEIKRFKGKTSALAIGICASAATLPFVACQTRLIQSSCVLMIHSPYATVQGDPTQLRKEAGSLEVLERTYAAEYARVMGITEAEALAMMQAETWFKADDAVRAGLAQAVADDFDTTISTEPARFNPAAFIRPPAALVAFARAKGWADAPAQSAMRKESPMALDDENAPLLGVKAAVTAERERVKRITDIVMIAGLPPEFGTSLIDAGTAIDQAVMAVRVEKAKDAPVITPGARVGRSFDGPQEIRAQMADAVAARLAPRMGVTHEPTVGRGMAHLSVPEMAIMTARGHGFRPTNATEAIQMMSHTTSDFTIAVGNGLQSVLAKAIQQAPVAIMRCAAEIDATDYRAGFSVGLSGASKMMPVGEAGEIKSGTLDERGEAKAVPANQALIVNVSREVLVNDAAAMNAFKDMTALMLRSATERQREILIAPLVANAGAGQTMRDGQPLFHATHGNLAVTGTVLTVASLSAARTAMRRQKGSKGEVFAIEPWALLVPPELETAAQQLVETLAANTVSSVNPFAESLEIIVEPGLTNLTAWYLVGNPAFVEGLTIAYLNGQKSPVVETMEGWKTLGTEFRMVWPIGAAFHEFASWFRNPGA